MHGFVQKNTIVTDNTIRKVNHIMRLYCMIFVMLCAGVTGYAQSLPDTAKTSKAAASVSDTAHETDDNTAADDAAHETDHPDGNTAGISANSPLDIEVKVSTFKIAPQYYGLPLAVRFGWFYRKEDFSVFPNAGFSFSIADTPVLATSAGLAIQKKSFFWNGYAVYDLVPFTMHKKADAQVVYGITSFGFSFPRIKVTLPLLAGRLRKNELVGDEKSSATRLAVVTQVSAGMQLDFFLADLGFFKSTGTAALYYHWIPKAAFHYYTFSAAVPASFHLYYVDIAFMYSLFHTSTVQYGTAAPLRRYAIGQTQSSMTGRSAFKPQTLFKDIHVFGTEFRWYPARITAQTNGFFLSLFADTGVGITERRKRTLLYEVGGGLGYNLYDSIPLTFQAGINQKLQPVFYLSAVSRLSHRP